ncbi:MAG: type 2 isopentenyl-diphosphate Delta-isomerase [Ignavibacteriales bacterium]|nr:MAG: type 2 isopentenyl-diphosphate Delta-isomerase [Ignavibacteriales bacterium]
MSETTSKRKKEHIELCLTDKVAFIEKSNGFDKYEFSHYAITEIEIEKIKLSAKFFNKVIDFPFLISCMTGGTMEAENINALLAVVANNLNIALGVGSQRQALENDTHHNSYKIIRKNAPKIPILGNIGAAQILSAKAEDKIKYLAELIEADAFVIHVNPLQELLQKNGEPNFKGFLKSLERICNKVSLPIIVKEVGAGINRKAAKKLLEAGVKGIDVAGAGGTSWAGVEILRNKDERGIEFWDWGIPTADCISEVKKLKNHFDFMLIGSGGINNGMDAAKALALGSDVVASARIILQCLDQSGIAGVEKLILSWFDTVKKVMYLTNSRSLNQLRKNGLQEIRK